MKEHKSVFDFKQNSHWLNFVALHIRCSDKSGNYSKYASVVYTNDYVAVVKPK